jgi:two-component system, sensor histidine kinase and response regulator
MSTEHVLVVDDSPTQVEAARGLLEDHGYTVETARTGEEALELARGRKFDLVISDVVMPGMSGWELCRAIKQQVAEPPPIVLLTSLTDPRDIVRGVECGADNYITKPYEPALLLKRIRHVLDNQGPGSPAQTAGPLTVQFLGETYTIESNPPQILALLLSSFEELIRTNAALQEARARAEQDTRHMEQLKQKAEAATRARDDVLATVSHDLKNPIGTIYTSSTLLLDVEMSPEAHRRQLDIIRRTAQRMDRLIEDLMDVSRIEAGHLTIEPQPESVASLLAEARELMSGIAQARNVRLISEPPDADLTVDADRHRVLQVFSNLIGNAVRFTPSGGSITVRAAAADDFVTFSVADTGAGIPDEDLPRVFDRFWHGGDGGGSGLGLAIVRGIVEAHGGEITAANEAGGGAVFTFTLPVASVSKSVPN